MEKLSIVSKTRPGADCGSHHELLIAKLGLKLKKVGKTTRPFRYDLNKIPFDYRGLECKSRKSSDTWSNSQIWLWSTKQAGQSLTEFCQEKALLIENTHLQQRKRGLYTGTSPDGQYQNQIDYILCSQRWRSNIQSAKQDQELTVAQIMNSLLPNSDLN